MRVEQLRTALKVAELKNFTRASAALFLEQATVSFHISTLEREIGFQLFNRASKHHSLEITDKGATFLLFANQAVQMIDEGVAQAKGA